MRTVSLKSYLRIGCRPFDRCDDILTVLRTKEKGESSYSTIALDNCCSVTELFKILKFDVPQSIKRLKILSSALKIRNFG